MRVASIDKIKIQSSNDYHKSNSNHIALCASKQGAHSADVGTLAPMFEKSATELKLKQKLPRCKSTVHIGTFNVRTLNRIGQLLELAAFVAEYDIDKNTDTIIGRYK